MQALHERILQVAPACTLWFSDGKNSDGKTIANPNIGYGFYTIKYADVTYLKRQYSMGWSLGNNIWRAIAS